jgi:hypothetical protein
MKNKKDMKYTYTTELLRLLHIAGYYYHTCNTYIKFKYQCYSNYKK